MIRTIPTVAAHPHGVFRATAAAVCCTLLMQGTPVHASGVIWPEPTQPQPSAQQAATLPGRAMQTEPNFRAPTATTCQRPPQRIDRPDLYRPIHVQTPYPSNVTLYGKADVAVVEGAGAASRQKSFESAPMTSPPPPPSPAVAADEAIAAQPSDRPHPAPQQPIVTVGMVDDNADFGEYLQFRNRTEVPHKPRDIQQRHLLQVRDAHGRGIPDAEVAVQSTTSQAAMRARTDSAGRAWLHPNAFDAVDSPQYRVTVRHGGSQQTTTLQRNQRSALELQWPAALRSQPAQLDLVFMIDATGSMADEIDKLKSSLQAIVREIAQLPAAPDICLGLVAYRDRRDAFFVRGWDFTNDVAAFQSVLDKLQANGGGDYPEAMSEALHSAVQDLSWRGQGTSRMLITLADAPPQLHYGGPQYDEEMLAALGKGIKLFGVGTSGLDSQGEFIMRQIAQYTGGRFIFLTYADADRPASGPGRETAHDVNNYSVDTLDRLIVQLVKDELAPLAW